MEKGGAMTQAAGRSGPVEVMMASDAASRMLGIELAGYGPGWARTRMTVRDDMVNGHGICHGGLIFRLAVTAVVLARHSCGPRTPAAVCDNVVFSSSRGGGGLARQSRQ